VTQGLQKKIKGEEFGTKSKEMPVYALKHHPAESKAIKNAERAMRLA
jgi:hypothetical protein